MYLYIYIHIYIKKIKLLQCHQNVTFLFPTALVTFASAHLPCLWISITNGPLGRNSWEGFCTFTYHESPFPFIILVYITGLLWYSLLQTITVPTHSISGFLLWNIWSWTTKHSQSNCKRSVNFKSKQRGIHFFFFKNVYASRSCNSRHNCGWSRILLI